MYSQNNEEEIILKYFGDFVGTFIDIGANDGVTLSNTRRLAELGWKGVCVEPMAEAFKRLEDNYKTFQGVYCYPYCLSHKNKMFTLNESSSLLTSNDVGLVSTFNDSEMDRFKSVVQYTPHDVRCFRWKTFLNRLKYKTFDFISIDIEGDEIKVLPQIDLTATRLICVEWNGKNKDKFTEICKGFRLIAENQENLIFGR